MLVIYKFNPSVIIKKKLEVNFMSKKFNTEEKQQLVTRYYNGESVSGICSQTGVARSTFYTWLKPHKVTVSDSGYAVSSGEFIRMAKRLDKLEKVIEVLQKVNCTNHAPLQDKLREIEILHDQYSRGD